MIRKRDEKISKKMLHTKMGGWRLRRRPKTRGIEQFRKAIQMRRENWEGIQENRKWE